jgi:hypothetical protein
MHTNQPVTDIVVVPGDELTLVHSSFPGEVARVKVPGIGEWFAVHFPLGSKVSDSTASIRFILVSYGPQGTKQLVTTDYDEWIEDHNEVNLGKLLPHELKQTMRHMPVSERAAAYREHLGDRFPMLPLADEKEL